MRAVGVGWPHNCFRDFEARLIYGLFHNGQLMAYASHPYWGEIIADIGVLIHPDYRSRGLGKAVVSLLCG